MKKLFLLLVLLFPVSIFSMSDSELAQVIGENYPDLIAVDISPEELDVRIGQLCQKQKEKFIKELEYFDNGSYAKSVIDSELEEPMLQHHYVSYESIKRNIDASIERAHQRYHDKCNSLPELKKRILFAKQIHAIHQQKTNAAVK